MLFRNRLCLNSLLLGGSILSGRDELERDSIRIAYCITPHGFGHAVRSCEVLRRLIEIEPGIEPVIISTIPDSIIEQNVGRRLPSRRVQFDFGLVQYDSIRFDLEKTLSALRRLREDSTALVQQEVQFLRKEKVRAIVSDIPFLAFDAARKCGIPGIGISNFLWDWIYQSYTNLDHGWKSIVSWARENYAKCTLLLQLPMHGDCAACPNIEDVPLVARKATISPEEIRRALGLNRDQRVFLVSFTALEMDRRAYSRLEKLRDVTFLYKSPLVFPAVNASNLDGYNFSYVDVVAAVDGVITKPGYGIVSDCLANGAPMIYTERGIFPEYEVLVGEMEKNLKTAYLSPRDFYEGNWEKAMDRICSSRAKLPQMSAGGAEACARRILDFL